MLHVFIQPSIEGIINRTFDLYDETLPLIQMDKVIPNLTSLVMSYTITGFILSPIELVRIRLIFKKKFFLNTKKKKKNIYIYANLFNYYYYFILFFFIFFFSKLIKIVIYLIYKF